MPGGIASVGGTFQDFQAASSQPETHLISGVSRDSGGNPLGGCVIECFDTATNTLQTQALSDINGNFTVRVSAPARQFYLVAYKPGSPDVAGTTVNTLTGTP